jgi:hypothetical protein
LFGDAFDFVFKANLKNLRIYEAIGDRPARCHRAELGILYCGGAARCRRRGRHLVGVFPAGL